MQLVAAGAVHAVIAEKASARTSVPHRVACAVRSEQLTHYMSLLSGLAGIEIEDWLDPTFPERASSAIPVVQHALADYHGRILLSGPFIDLNPGSSERLIQKATRQRFDECYQFARAIGAHDITFLSSYLPIINLSFYDQGWLTKSVAFWRSYVDNVDPHVTVSLCNTFEYHPNLMLQVLQEVARPNFRLTFDLGHFLVYGHEPLSRWLGATASYTSSVYVHSNDGKVDSHEEPDRGVLTRTQMNEVARAVGPEANLILKMNDKESLQRSLAWMESCFTEGGPSR